VARSHRLRPSAIQVSHALAMNEWLLSIGWAVLSLIAWAVWYGIAKSELRAARIQVPGWIEWFAPIMLLGVVKGALVPAARRLFPWGYLVSASCIARVAAVGSFPL